ncbi:MAG: DegT/DnrJ/EryC1/StrS family aminotransferase [Ruminococcus sp.]|nr:DegT/DnrJ/EryC1/StrS family aminotransferase [Ruminococcus sp.]
MPMNSNDKNYSGLVDKYVTGKILVTRSSMPAYEEYCEEIKDIWDTHWLTNMGPKHKKLREELAKYLGVEKIDLLTNGHMALELTMQALGLTGEVITTPFTFASTTHAIVRNGLTPVFCDIDPENFTIDTSKIEALITDKTSAIVPVHVYGNICNIEEIGRIADKYGLKVIYDAAHTFGETYKGKGVGSFGDVSCFSFHATKVFNTVEGGAVCFKEQSFGDRMYDLKNFGIHGPEKVESVGANAKMNEFSAAMGICNLRHVDEEIEKRRKVTERYHERLGGVEGVRLNKVSPDVKPNYAYLPAIFDEEKFGCGRDEVFRVLAEHNIGARKYFYPLTNSFDCFSGRFDPNDTPAALKISRSVLTLPLYADLTTEQVDLICDLIISCKK